MEALVRSYPILHSVRNPRLEDGIVTAYVPIELIELDEAAVDIQHVETLVDQIRTSGLTTPVTLAIATRFDRFQALDGLHRLAAVREIGLEEIRSSIKPITDLQEYYDLRIAAAADHKSVKFSRLVLWVEEAWKDTPWSDRLLASDAFRLTYSPRFAGSNNFGLTEGEDLAVRQWAQHKSGLWKVVPATAVKNLLLAEKAAADLVQQVRTRDGGSDLKALTYQHLDVIATAMRDRHELQRLTAEAVVANNFTVQDTRTLALVVSASPNLDAARAAIARYLNPHADTIIVSTSASNGDNREKEINKISNPIIEELARFGYTEEEAQRAIEDSLQLLEKVNVKFKSAAAGEVVYRSGDSANLVIIKKGHLLVYKFQDDGIEHVSEIIDSFSIAEFEELGDDQESEIYLKPLVDSSIAVISSRYLKQIAEFNPAVSLVFSAAQAVRLREAGKRAEDRRTKTLRQRLAGALLDIADRADPTMRGVKQTLIADLVGGSREQVNRHLRELSAEGLVEWMHTAGGQYLDKKRLMMVYKGLE